MATEKCRICRRLGEKLFLKGEKCLSPKCPIIKRPYPPGQKSKRARPSSSEYSKQLREKQKLKKCYNLRERQFKKYVQDRVNLIVSEDDPENSQCETIQHEYYC